MSDENDVPVESSTFQQPTMVNGQNGHAADLNTASGMAPAEVRAQTVAVEVDKRLELFQIHVESNPRNTLLFIGGEVIKGTVVMTLTEALEVDSLDLNLIGGSTVGWKAAAAGQQEAEKYAIEYYVEETRNILGILPGENLLVSKGTHKFRFHFRLPLDVPATFQGTYGNVNYILKATLKTPLGTNVYVAKVQVQQYLETPKYLKFLSPAEVRIKKHYPGRGIKAVVTGPIEAVFAVTRMGFTFGEPIEINGHVLNRSYALVTSVEANLVQRCVYMAQEARTSEARVVKKVEDVFDVQHNAIRRWKEVKLIVPEDCAPSYLDGCKLLETFYELCFVVNVKSSKSLVATLPVVIGLGSLQHTAKMEVEKQRSSGAVSPSLGTLRTQIFDYGTITSSAMRAPDPYTAQVHTNGEQDTHVYANANLGLAVESGSRPDEQRKAQRQPHEYTQAEVNHYDEALE